MVPWYQPGTGFHLDSLKYLRVRVPMSEAGFCGGGGAAVSVVSGCTWSARAPPVRGGLYVGVLLWYGVAGSQCRVLSGCVCGERCRCGLLGGTGSHPE